MGGRGTSGSRNGEETRDNRSVGVIYRDEHLGMKSAINEQFRQGNITKEQRDKAVEKITQVFRQSLKE